MGDIRVSTDTHTVQGRDVPNGRQRLLNYSYLARRYARAVKVKVTSTTG